MIITTNKRKRANIALLMHILLSIARMGEERKISLAVNIFPMPNFDHTYHQILVLNPIQDAVAVLPKAVFILSR